MLDWDQELEAIHAPEAAVEPAPTVSKRAILRAYASRWLMPAVVAVGIILAGQSVFRLNLLGSNSVAAVAAAGELRAALMREPDAEMPAELIVYDARLYANFMRGIVRFSDSDLLEYAATTARDLAVLRNPMTPYMLDVLFLTNREIERRGLSRSLVSAAFDRERDDFHAQRRDL